MITCPECGTKLDDISQVCPVCGRGNVQQDKHLNLFLIVLFIVISSFFIIFYADKTYSAGDIIEKEMPDYLLSYNNSKWYEYKHNDVENVLKYNSSSREAYLYLAESMMDLKEYNYSIDDLSELRGFLYSEFIVKGQNKYSNMSSEIKPVGNNYYFTTSYVENGINARMYGVITSDNKLTVMYLVTNDLDVEEDVLDVIKTVKIK